MCNNGNGLLQEGLSGWQRSREGIPFTYLIKCRSLHLCEGASYKVLKPYRCIIFLRISAAVEITYFCIGYPELLLATQEC